MNERWVTLKDGRRVRIKTTSEYMNDFIRNKGNYKLESREYDDSKFKYLPEDDEQMSDQYYEMTDESQAKLTRGEIVSIRASYVGTEHSYEINEALRNDEKETPHLVQEDFEQIVSQLDKACNTYTAKSDMASVRYVNMDYLRNAYGIDIPYGDIDRSQIANKMKEFEGSSISSKGFTSVSLAESGSPTFKNLAVKMKINLPTGTSMYVSGNLGESEAILGRNKKMELVKVDFQESGITGMEKEYGKILLTYEVINNDKK